ncbi:tail fiber protein [Leifsonia kafniensis]|uniref:Tail fiber protein n=1 Tax=Leifsonia kafniensis TaxID=475957 RepID=A0ABP7KGS4_9MICO
MAQPYVGEIRIFAGNFPPAGWMFCEGQLIPISENETLFQLVGTTYGGDGESTFALPDFRGRFPIHQGNGYTLAETGGAEAVTLTTQQIPIHNHVPLASKSAGNSSIPDAKAWAAWSDNPYSDAAVTGAKKLHPAALAQTGGSQPHDNMPPYLALSLIISLFGIFPSPT